MRTVQGHSNIVMSLAVFNSQIISGSWDETIKFEILRRVSV
ncbi:MAG: hypothetical protein QNJ72_15750 [Pleurocapsa sp. MO_226.B13]|nr:hypothetical protein [Pleurocapsa sp. MO_226.B13]